MNYYEKSLVIFCNRLKQNIEYFRNGDELISIDMAVQIRTLLHDTKNQKSLLNNLNKEDRLTFLSVVNEHLLKGVVSFQMSITEPVSKVMSLPDLVFTKYEPMTSSLLRAEHIKKENGKVISTYKPLSMENNLKGKSLLFDERWNENVAFIDNPKYYFTRKYIVLGVCDQDGGAHYDEKANTPFRDFKKQCFNGYVH
jgi:hypothetical protein